MVAFIALAYVLSSLQPTSLRQDNVSHELGALPNLHTDQRLDEAQRVLGLYALIGRRSDGIRTYLSRRFPNSKILVTCVQRDDGNIYVTRWEDAPLQRGDRIPRASEVGWYLDHTIQFDVDPGRALATIVDAHRNLAALRRGILLFGITVNNAEADYDNALMKYPGVWITVRVNAKEPSRVFEWSAWFDAETERSVRSLLRRPRARITVR